MPTEELAAAVRARLGDDLGTEESFGGLHVDVPPDRWVQTHERARTDGELDLRFFDWLSAYDEGPAGLVVVSHLWSVARRHGLLLRTRLPADDPELDTLTGVFPGANWHERETFEMFGIRFTGHPLLVPLLLPDGFEGHPLRKDFVLASRVAKAWPGAKEPGESDHDTGRSRRRVLPPGVPADEEWGGSWR